jgi:4-hydroxybenzoate polyprenyltransferase
MPGPVTLQGGNLSQRIWLLLVAVVFLVGLVLALTVESKQTSAAIVGVALLALGIYPRLQRRR